MTKPYKRFKMAPLAERYEAISSWFGTPLGRRLLMHERKVLAEELNCLFGYHFMQLSSVRQASFAALSRINHCFSLAPTTGEGDEHPFQGVSNFDALPLESESIDVTLLHHVLEFSENPHQVLKEAARVTIPRGYLIIVAFNPLSVAGFLSAIAGLSQNPKPARRRALRTGRLTDWLEFLDFSCCSTRNVFHNLPINNARYLSSTRFLERLSLRNKMPGGMSYILVARKDITGMRPIRPGWEKPRLLDVVPIGKQAIRVKNSREPGMVLPFRLRRARSRLDD